MKGHESCPCNTEHPRGEDHPACTGPPAPCMLLGPFHREASCWEAWQRTSHGFLAAVTGEISILLQCLLWVNASCTAEVWAAASQKIHPLLQLWFPAHGLFPAYCLLARDHFSHVPISVFFLSITLDEKEKPFCSGLVFCLWGWCWELLVLAGFLRYPRTGNAPTALLTCS